MLSDLFEDLFAQRLREQAKCPLVFTGGCDAKRDLFLGPIERVDLIGFDPRSVVVEPQIAADFWRDFDG